MYQRVGNVRFLENFAYLLNEWFLSSFYPWVTNISFSENFAKSLNWWFPCKIFHKFELQMFININLDQTLSLIETTSICHPAGKCGVVFEVSVFIRGLDLAAHILAAHHTVTKVSD